MCSVPMAIVRFYRLIHFPIAMKIYMMLTFSPLYQLKIVKSGGELAKYAKKFSKRFWEKTVVKTNNPNKGAFRKGFVSEFLETSIGDMYEPIDIYWNDIKDSCPSPSRKRALGSVWLLRPLPSMLP